jgi:hypothetical protein
MLRAVEGAPLAKHGKVKMNGKRVIRPQTAPDRAFMG